jgi:TonB family protein
MNASRMRAAAHYYVMKHRFGNRVLLWAFGLSILAHVVFALVTRIPRVEAAPEQMPTHVRIDRLVLRTPAPTPQPPQPHVRAVAHANTAPRVHVDVPRVSGPGTQSTSGPAVVATSGVDVPGDPNAVATASAPPPRPACSVPNAPARTISAAMPQTPDGVEGLPATAEVQVTLDAAGRVTDLRIYRSAYNQQLDRAAIAAAKASTYAPALVDCLPAGGTYLFTVEFQD